MQLPETKRYNLYNKRRRRGGEQGRRKEGDEEEATLEATQLLTTFSISDGESCPCKTPPVLFNSSLIQLHSTISKLEDGNKSLAQHKNPLHLLYTQFELQ